MQNARTTLSLFALGATLLALGATLALAQPVTADAHHVSAATTATVCKAEAKTPIGNRPAIDRADRPSLLSIFRSDFNARSTDNAGKTRCVVTLKA